MSTPLVAALIVVFGLPVGSFTNVVIYRLRVRATKRNISIEEEIALEDAERAAAEADADEGDDELDVASPTAAAADGQGATGVTSGADEPGLVAEATAAQTAEGAVNADDADGSTTGADDLPGWEPLKPWEEDLRISTGRSLCPNCGEAVKARDNIPLISYLLLQGRCRSCGWRIPLTYPVVELAVPLLGLAMLATFGATWPLVAFLWLVPVAVAAAAVDFQVFLIPRELVWVGWPGGVALIVLASIQQDAIGGPTYEPMDEIQRAVLGSLIYFVVLFIFHFINPRGMGFGDVRFGLVLGLFVGYTSLLLLMPSLVFASLLGLVGGTKPVVRLVLPSEAGKPYLKRRVPFGPWLVLGSLLCIWFYEPLLDLLGQS